METRKMTAKKAKELLYDIETFVHNRGANEKNYT